jgi:hypothetical protein
VGHGKSDELKGVQGLGGMEPQGNNTGGKLISNRLGIGGPRKRSSELLGRAGFGRMVSERPDEVGGGRMGSVAGG